MRAQPKVEPASTSVAVCFHGLIGGTAGKDGKGDMLDPQIAGNLAKQNLLRANSADSFIHTWDAKFEALLSEIYQPVTIRTDPRLFEEDFRDSRPNWLSSRLVQFYGQNKVEAADARFRAISRFTSALRSLELVETHESKTGKTFHRVLFARLDVAHLNPIRLRTHLTDTAYVSHWNRAPGAGSSVPLRENLNTAWGCLDFWISVPRSKARTFVTTALRLSKVGLNPHRATYRAIKASRLKLAYEGYRGVDVEMVRRLMGANE